jgi:hypothetical protein
MPRPTEPSRLYLTPGVLVDCASTYVRQIRSVYDGSLFYKMEKKWSDRERPGGEYDRWVGGVPTYVSVCVFVVHRHWPCCNLKPLSRVLTYHCSSKPPQGDDRDGELKSRLCSIDARRMGDGTTLRALWARLRGVQSSKGAAQFVFSEPEHTKAQ